MCVFLTEECLQYRAKLRHAEARTHKQDLIVLKPKDLLSIIVEFILLSYISQARINDVPDGANCVIVQEKVALNLSYFLRQ